MSCTSEPCAYWRTTGREPPPSPRAACIRTSGPGTPRSSRSASDICRRYGRSGSWRRCWTPSGRTGGSRTSSSTPPSRSTRTSRAPTSGAPRPRGAPRAPRAPYRPQASCSHRCTRSPPGWCTAPTRACPAPAASSPGCIPAWPPGTAICCTAVTSAEAAWCPSSTPGSRAWTTAPAGMPRWPASPPPRPAPSAAPTSTTGPPRTGRRTWTTGGTCGWRRTTGIANTPTEHPSSPSRTPPSMPCSSPPSTPCPGWRTSWARRARPAARGRSG